MVRCNRCGRQWTRHPALEVGCPRCGAPAGGECIRPSGHSGPFVEPHAEREKLAVYRGVLEPCPATAGRQAPTENRLPPPRGSAQPALPL